MILLPDGLSFMLNGMLVLKCSKMGKGKQGGGINFRIHIYTLLIYKIDKQYRPTV